MENTTYILDEKLLVSGGRRFLNYILDLFFYVIFIFCVAFITTLVAALLGLTDLVFWLQNIPDMQANVIAVIVMLIYYILTEGIFGRSLAKFITGTVVVDENGEKPTFGILFQRTLCRLIPFDALSFLGNSGRGWHDSISDTYVVDKKELEKSIRVFNEMDQIGEFS
ncbi:RDD family protein [Flavobacterium aquiphilum]|uniref:RDD family protein n=1 Tax=Flavobacterium aquiphilum TaxID=3003261 RepID=UPI00248056F9|nr:RDD family protein [Flavobacterium aquiphilum]